MPVLKEGQLIDFIPRLLVFLKECDDFPAPQIQRDGSVFWHAVYKKKIAMRIVEKGESLAIFFKFGAEWLEPKYDDDGPKIQSMITPLLTKIKAKAIFFEPPKKQGVLVGCRSYKEILDDLAGEYLKTQGMTKDEIKKRIGELSYINYRDRIADLIMKSPSVDPSRVQVDKVKNIDRHIYGVTYEHFDNLYIKLVEDKVQPAELQWNGESIICVDPRLKEVADAALRAFHLRMSLSQNNRDLIHNFIAEYVRIRTAINKQAAAEAAAKEAAKQNAVQGRASKSILR
jgi:hypothetical protein